SPAPSGRHRRSPAASPTTPRRHTACVRRGRPGIPRRRAPAAPAPVSTTDAAGHAPPGWGAPATRGRPSQPSVVPPTAVLRPAVLRPAVLGRTLLGRPLLRWALFGRAVIGRPLIRRSLLGRAVIGRPLIRRSLLQVRTVVLRALILWPLVLRA